MEGLRCTCSVSAPDELKTELTLCACRWWRERCRAADVVECSLIQSGMSGRARDRDRCQVAIIPDDEDDQYLPAGRAADLTRALDAAQDLAGIVGCGRIAMRAGLCAGGGLTGGMSSAALLAAARGSLGGIALRHARLLRGGRWCRPIRARGRFAADFSGKLGGACVRFQDLRRHHCHHLGRRGHSLCRSLGLDLNRLRGARF